ncbi:MAG: prepilin-type cleavage/methylation domain-containing protein [Synechococcaceae bacterium WB9_2_112]|nr:prepilin-type cleavage/methylation domain-containing protein [Synechococcaceae bacterium WB9_2_112]
MAGFSLLELLLSLSLGLLLSGVMLQGLIDEGQNGQRLARLLRERAVQRRTLALVKLDLAQATGVSQAPERDAHACGLAGRLPVLHLSTAVGSITYSVGSPPSPIWRGQVLMRCGPAYGLDGVLSTGNTAQNRVVIDGLPARPPRWLACGGILPAHGSDPIELGDSVALGFSACLDASSGLVALRLLQEFPGRAGRPSQRLMTTAVAGGA